MSTDDNPRIKQNVSFDPENYAAVQAVQKKRRLGGKGFSTALNPIIQEHGHGCQHLQTMTVGQTVIKLMDVETPRFLTQAVTIGLCNECGEFIVTPLDAFDADQRTINANAAVEAAG